MQKNHGKPVGKLTNRGIRFWHELAIHGPKKGPKTVFFPNALFLRFHWDLPTIFAMGSYPKRQKKALFGQKSYSKGPNHALEKVLTNETPGIPVPITTLSCRIGSIRLFPE